ncbi:GTP diphosphokinase [Psychrobium sp. 1_MG-2023]|uniref:GTP diphosphokinase n=1 Tax=Psychrobium sp. 1_MG-2023 TaxID=3062624 RepID=UPI0027330548|nr:GTP diphosphokinase [Psychrobium sp. 1_MG-2023]MDP2560580.1 GTP diphosphokinase [Psychrobium sp. 1_MG-2023]
MVAVREGHLAGDFDLDQWVTKFGLDKAQAKHLRALYLQLESACVQENAALMIKAREMAEILQSMHMDLDTLKAALIFPWFELELLDQEEVEQLTSKGVFALLRNVNEMAAIKTLHVRGRNLSGVQVDNLRRMLMAMVADVRAVIIKLAERVAYLRDIKNEDEEVRVLAAREIADIYAPLANRLGIGQLKWELEDISFRYLHPKTYKKIASLLDQKRLERESYIAHFVEHLKRKLNDDGISANVYGRPKHIYSIWKKMDNKNIEFEQLFDVRAIRVVVDEIQDCYGALGTLHTLWHHVPSEFSDYVANPKPNGYQSIHSIVVGPEGRTVEVQIRTEQMHQDAEMGVAAHWRYKEGSGATKGSSFESKIEWLRKILAWQDDVKDSGNLAEEIRSQVFDDRIYVYTPTGEVIDMPAGCTPLDFAYYIHSQVGHRCIGAKINDRIVPFTYKLQTGEQVEILTAKEPNPKRDWLNPRLGYVFSSRSRSKIQHFFKQQDRDKNLVAGREVLENELTNLGLKLSDAQIAVQKYNFNNFDDLVAAVGCGDVRINALVNYIQSQLIKSEEPPEPVLKRTTLTNTKNKSEVVVEGVGNLLTHMAKCCQPIPGDDIDGFISQGKGISIHRRDCEQLKQLLTKHPERNVEVHWGSDSSAGYSLEVTLFANDRTGLIRDISAIIANDKVSLLGMNTRTNESTQIATIGLTLEVPGQEVLSRLLAKLSSVEGIFEVKRG